MDQPNIIKLTKTDYKTNACDTCQSLSKEEKNKETIY